MRPLHLALGLSFITLLALASAVSSFEERGLPAAEWKSYEEALSQARSNGKPVMVLFTAPWCGACKRLKEQLRSPEMTAKFQLLAADFNLVSIEAEGETPSQAGFSPDGGYVPRAFFLRPDGSPDYSLVGPNPKYKHFFASPDLLLTAMGRAKTLAHTKTDL